MSCDSLNGLVIPAAAIGLSTTGAAVTSTSVVPAAGSGAAAVGEYCKVLGDINPVDVNAPKIKFQVNLPTTWNNKAMMFGGGGNNGTVPNVVGNVPAGPTDQLVPLGRGYATFASDSGHQGKADATIDALRDGSFGVNDEAARNYGGDALKKTRDVAFAIINARYAAAPQKTYFAGGSTGGREALVAISRWPQDFDGAIAVYPAWDAVNLYLFWGNATRELAKAGAYPSRAKRQALYDAAVQTCDGLDGVLDGVISNQAACNVTFNPASAMLNGAPLRCAAGADIGDSCLSDAQINVFKTLNAPLNLNYALASGEMSYPGFNVWGGDYGMPGAPTAVQSTALIMGLGTLAPAYPMPPVTASAFPISGSVFWDQFIKFFVTRDANFNSLAVDPVNPGALQARIVDLSATQAATKADLSAFQAKGGKLLILHGTQDVLVSPRATQVYMTRLRTVMGLDKVTSFARHYEVPGYSHVTGSAFYASWDSVSALEAWVEKGTAPANPVVTDRLVVPGRTRPLCEFPSWPKYKGSGDINLAANFACATQ